jgi:branched-chain amino acid transport system substrate-binding protein
MVTLAMRRVPMIAVLTVLALAACGEPAPSGPGGTPGSAGTVSGAPDADAVTDYLAYVGGRAGAADPALPPVQIGWVNMQGGQLSYPAATEGAQAAVTYVNAELGGIGGRPLALRTCFIAQAEEEGQKCGQQLLNDPAVSVIAYGAVAVGSQALTSVVDGGKPIVVGVSSAPSDSTAKNVFLLHGDQEHLLADLRPPASP